MTEQITIRTVKTVTNGRNGNKFTLKGTLTEDPQKVLQQLQQKHGIPKNVIERNVKRCRWCAIRKSCDFSFIGQEWQAVWGIHRIQKYDRNQPMVLATEASHSSVMKKADEVLVICEGEVKSHRVGIGGNESLRRICKPGNMIMDVDFFAGGQEDRTWGEGPVVEDVRTNKDTVAAHIPGDVFATLVRRNPALLERKITQMARAALFSAKDNHSARHLTAKQRLMRTLNLQKNDKNEVNMTLKDIAASSGLAVETACRIMKDMREIEYIARENGSKKMVLTREFFKSHVFRSIQYS